MRQSYLHAVLENAGGHSLATFNDRLLIQKRIYLLAAVGISLGYRYNWYLRGPYSPLLTKDLFELAHEDAQHHARPVALPTIMERKIRGLKALLGSKWDNPNDLELVVSIHFLKSLLEKRFAGSE